MDETELQEKKRKLKKRILTLEWDKKRHQINYGKAKILEELNKELEDLDNPTQEIKEEIIK